MKRARIVGVGAYAPKRILTNAELEKMVATSRRVDRPAHAASASGTSPTRRGHLRPRPQAPPSRRWSGPAWTPDEIDFIVVGTTTGDMQFPTTANFVQHRLGCRNAGSVDV